MSREIEIQKQIMVAISPYVAIFRTPAGMYYQGKMINTPEYGRVIQHPRAVKILVPGFPDLSGFDRETGQAVFIEVKTPTGKATKEQEQFLDVAKSAGCKAGIARSAEEALEIIGGGDHD